MIWVSADSSGYPNRKTLGSTLYEGKVLRGELLISNLPTRYRIAPSCAGVDNEVAVVLVILVTAAYNDRVSSLLSGTRDPMLKRFVYTGMR